MVLLYNIIMSTVQRFAIAVLLIAAPFFASAAELYITPSNGAYSVGDLSYLEYGIAQARRGWAEKKDIMNTLPFKKLLELLKKPKSNRFV